MVGGEAGDSGTGPSVHALSPFPSLGGACHMPGSVPGTHGLRFCPRLRERWKEASSKSWHSHMTPTDAGAPGGAAPVPGVKATGMREAESGREGLWVEGQAGTKASGQDWAWPEPREGQPGGWSRR